MSGAAIRVAVTGPGGDAGSGTVLGLREGAAASGGGVWVLGLAAEPAAGAAELDAFERLPPVSSPDYVERLLAAARAHRVEVLLPAIDSEIVVLSRARRRLAEAPELRVALAPEDVVEAADDKLATARFLEARGLPVARTVEADAAAAPAPPLVAKPRRGHAGRGVRFLDDAAALSRFRAESLDGHCLQERLDGPELTLGFLYDRDGRCRDAIAMERELERGRTVAARVRDDPEVERFLAAFGERVTAVGALNVQLRMHPARGPVVFEMNARLSGSTAFRVRAGFNDPWRLARHLALGEPIERARVQRVALRRRGAELVEAP